MLRILLDENVPVALARRLAGYEVRHVFDESWGGLSNGTLLAAAEAAGFDAMVTADRNLRFQQNLTRRRLALVVLSSNNWSLIRSRL